MGSKDKKELEIAIHKKTFLAIVFIFSVHCQMEPMHAKSSAFKCSLSGIDETCSMLKKKSKNCL